MNEWQKSFERALEAKLSKALNEFGDKEVQRLDVGIFPWDALVEISFLFSEDVVNDPSLVAADGEDDEVAAWPHYNYSRYAEGEWPEARETCEAMEDKWGENEDAEPFFVQAGEVLRNQTIQEIINKFNRSLNFELTVYDPDSPESRHNYCTVV
jgi:hypothetical protein